MTEESVLGVQILALQKSVDDGFARQDRRLGEIEGDLKKMNGEGFPRRVKSLEMWKDRMSGKLWALLTGVILALIGALIGVVI